MAGWLAGFATIIFVFWVGKYDESKYQNCLRIKKYFESEGQGTIGQKLFSAGFKKKNGYYNSKFQ